MSALALVTSLGIAVAADVNGERTGSGQELGARTLTKDSRLHLTAAQERTIYLSVANAEKQPAPQNQPMSVGATVPDSVRLGDLPGDVRQQVGAVKHFKYAKLQDEKLLLVDPADRVVVGIITKREGSAAAGQDPAIKAAESGMSERDQDKAEVDAYRNPARSMARSDDGQAGPSGTRSVDRAAVVTLTFYTVQPADMRASDLIGATVYNLSNESIGEVEDLVVDGGNNLRALIIGVGGFLGIGERNVAIEPKSATVTEQPDGAIRVVVNTSKEELEKAPQVRDEDLDANDGTTGR